MSLYDNGKCPLKDCSRGTLIGVSALQKKTKALDLFLRDFQVSCRGLNRSAYIPYFLQNIQGEDVLVDFAQRNINPVESPMLRIFQRLELHTYEFCYGKAGRGAPPTFCQSGSTTL